MRQRLLQLLAVFSLLTGTQAWACTSIIVSGKSTPDGRPLMWKHRDTEVRHNHIAYHAEGRYAYIGLTNSDPLDKDIWIGTNDQGFSIMNTASFNLKDDTIQIMGQEGTLMRQALEICATAQDFEHFLDTLSRPLRVEANFGVIDAHGAAAYYETNNTCYYKKDVNDPLLAPDGYLIYTNFSTEGRPDEGYGFVRFETARQLFSDMYPRGITPLRIFNEVSSSFYHSLLDIDLKTEPRQEWWIEQDFISRKESTASIVIQGVKEGMNPELTTLWAELGYPPTAIALPLWVKMGNSQPALVSYDEQIGTAPLCLYATRLKEQAYPIHKGNGQKYIHWHTLWNNEGTGYIQGITPVRDEIYKRFTTLQAAWEEQDLDTEHITRLYDEVTPIIEQTYKRLMTD